ncbi:hypothetical protein [Antarcticimicrobium sediminis]|uniref:PXPV repeat-containing protein n=1 Tax=Antarcticimicrobium sediminis TaxID=2546227 RepID=A0A4V2Z7C3_9RHOB|nr:hypothetical protein [Antarcticimicrobium sediminis]TDE35966.1 hypothetical protein E1B25_15905 [Antarcticimicrobium sediminis]
MTRKVFSHRSFIALISGLALTVAITGATAAPARADNDAARIFAGLVGLAIIGAAIEDSRNDRGPVVHQRRVVVHQPPQHVYQQPRPVYQAPRPVYQPPRAYAPQHQHHTRVQTPPRRQVIVRKRVVNKRIVHVHR